jgi:hypothetical protein
MSVLVALFGALVEVRDDVATGSGVEGVSVKYWGFEVDIGAGENTQLILDRASRIKTNIKKILLLIPSCPIESPASKIAYLCRTLIKVPIGINHTCIGARWQPNLVTHVKPPGGAKWIGARKERKKCEKHERR